MASSGVPQLPSQSKWTVVDRLLDMLTNKLHIFIGSLVHSAILLFHFKTHLDIPSGIQNSEYAFLAFLAGHAFTYQRYPDKDNTNAV